LTRLLAPALTSAYSGAYFCKQQLGGELMPEIALSRRVAAEPASLALLLAGPTAVELWPGARRIGDFGDRFTVEADLPDGESSEVHLQALPPRRTPTAFVIRFEYSGVGIPSTNGTITLTSQGSGSSRAELVLRWEGGIDRLIREDTESKAASFLATLATAAEERSSAA
jgi:hypothetical protein